MKYRTASLEQIKKYYQLETDNGLSPSQIKASREKYGHNDFSTKAGPNLFQKILHHLLEVMNIILLLVGGLSAYLAAISNGNYTKTVVVLLIVIINVVVSVFQESRAENALAALKKLASPTSTVLRSGKIQTIASNELVCGDIIELSAGVQVGADIRLLTSNSLQIDESSLTGESEPIDKNAEVEISTDVPLGDQLNMVFSGTNVLNGTGRGIVVAVGKQSQMGQIATLIGEQVKGKTPLQKRIDKLAKRLAIIAFAAGVLIFIINLFYGNVPLVDNLMTAVVLGVAAVPETLPVIVTLSLIYGVENMAQKKAIIRNIPAVETLGNATVIASDKTGTLTQNQMTIQKIWLSGQKVWSEGHLSDHEVTLLQNFAYASNATAQFHDGGWEIHGDPTEAAIIRFLIKHDLYHPENSPKRIIELPFDSTRKKMSVVIPHPKTPGRYMVLTKGAFDRLAPTSQHQPHHPQILHIDGTAALQSDPEEALLLEAENIHDDFAANALRVLALSYKDLDEIPKDLSNLEENLNFLGIVGMIDPPRDESKAAVQEARTAGIKPIMITGDHALTAKAIAKQIDIFREGDRVVDGPTLSQMSNEELNTEIEKISVYARVSPEDKLRIVKAWQEKGQIVAMTGDGVNDAPSLRAADVGTAMGIAGTEVAKSASDIVLADDNFATIVAAIREGRRVYTNIKKTIYYLLSANVAEILTMLIGAIVGWGLPFTGIQLLYINVLADGIPGFGLSREKADSHLMEQPPIGVKESIFSRGVSQRIAICATAFIFTALTGFYIGKFIEIGGLTPHHQLGQTMAFVILTIASTINVYNARSNESLFKRGITTNKTIFGTTLLSLAITIIFTNTPLLMNILEIVPLSLTHWLIAITLALIPTLVIEVTKVILNKTGKKFIG
ncbi:cation-translocating P-type ATPase [Lactococcus taiwanensis]|jgi:Ca2+-transporting ATPase|uniref:cation-translocating P-type ATPase n=1 Tax=Lactococcus taiwanensis TaxID=1151742 RepID=UPI0007B218FB|nr:cation-translocating P-type ATPase [Lactococcus taiwanensis]KZK36839.1 Calcium-transporting ATPase [Lactococcus cremoris]QRZ10744.1 cation-translocating P-type ATPase [Lactococcus taiwanensis]